MASRDRGGPNKTPSEAPTYHSNMIQDPVPYPSHMVQEEFKGSLQLGCHYAVKPSDDLFDDCSPGSRH